MRLADRVSGRRSKRELEWGVLGALSAVVVLGALRALAGRTSLLGTEGRRPADPDPERV